MFHAYAYGDVPPLAATVACPVAAPKQFCAMVLTAAIGLYAALKASAAVARYVATGEFQVDWSAAKAKVTGFFSKKEDEAPVNV